MDKLARPTSNMSAAETEAWVSMAKDRTLRDSLAETAHYQRRLQRRMEALRRKREGLSV